MNDSCGGSDIGKNLILEILQREKLTAEVGKKNKKERKEFKMTLT